jgi:hypothetical protein
MLEAWNVRQKFFDGRRGRRRWGDETVVMGASLGDGGAEGVDMGTNELEGLSGVEMDRAGLITCRINGLPGVCVRTRACL